MSSTGSRTWRFCPGCGRRRVFFFFERFAADSPEQKLTLCDDVAGLSQAGEFPFNPDTSAGAETECVSMFRYEAHVRPSSVQSQDYTFKVPDWYGDV
ncbi:contractile injection system protein, VgrG/Pvc8 family [Escherichia coli]|nr:contractile injection system protein, VgrG/Pvc8 family [Escherichia coli]